MDKDLTADLSHLAAFVRAVRAPAILVGADGETILAASDAFVRLAKLPAATLVGTSWRKLVDKAAGERRAAHLEAARRTSRQVDFEDARLDGARATHSIVPVAPDGEAACAFVWTSRDLSDEQRVAAELARSEARLLEAQHVGRMGSWELDLATNTLTWSDEVYRLFQVDRAQFGATYEAFLAAIHPYDRSAVDSGYRRSLETRTPYSVAHRVRLPDGEIRWVQESCETTYDAGGKPVRSIGTVQDITDRVVAEQELRRTRDLLRLVLDSSPDPIFVKDLEHRFVLVNRAFARGRGVEADALIGRSDTEFLPPGAWGGNPGAGLVGTHEDDQEVFAGKEITNAIRVRPHADGTAHTYETFKLPLRDEMGHVYGLLSYLRDVTDWLSADEVQRQADARFREFMDSLPDAVLVNHEGRYVYANHAAATLLGYARREDVQGVPVEELVAAHDLPAVRLAQEKADQIVGPVERTWRRRDGGTVVVEVAVLPTSFAGRPARVVVGRDTSARKELAARIAQMDRLVAVGTLAAGVAHEINNPLAYVLSNLQFVASEIDQIVGRAEARGERRDLSPRLSEMRVALVEALDGAERVKGIVLALRSFAREPVDYRRPVVVEQVIDSAASMAWNEVRHRARLVKDYGPVPSVRANESRLAQAILNLLLNAAQAIPEGQAERNEITVRTRTDAAGRAVIEVSDTGCGIAPDIVGQIFDPFFTTKPVGAGAGLGLSICRNIVHGLGGEISAHEREPRGTTLRVCLPGVHEVPAGASDEALPVDAPRQARVIVVDDEPLIGRSLIRGLANEHQVVAVTRGSELLERLAAGERFDVVFCDLMMPEMSGMDLYAEVVARFPEHAARFVFLTGGAFTASAADFLEHVGAPKVEKPFTMASIRTLIRSLVG